MKVFLTGASAGIGAETTRMLCRAGHEVWGSSRSIRRLPALDRFHPVELDLLDQNSIVTACEQVWRESGGIDVLVNNAGQAIFGPLEQMAEKDIRAQFEILFFGPLFLQQKIMARMRAGKGGLILNVTSLSAELPIPFMGAYSSAKASFSAATTVLRLEMPDQKIRCLELRPGDINTDFNQAVTHGAGAEGTGAQKAWQSIEKNMAGAPPAAKVAEKILELIENREAEPVSRVGDWFQATLAPLGPKFLPARLMEKLIRSYYGIR